MCPEKSPLLFLYTFDYLPHPPLHAIRALEWPSQTLTEMGERASPRPWFCTNILCYTYLNGIYGAELVFCGYLETFKVFRNPSLLPIQILNSSLPHPCFPTNPSKKAGRAPTSNNQRRLFFCIVDSISNLLSVRFCKCKLFLEEYTE